MALRLLLGFLSTTLVIQLSAAPGARADERSAADLLPPSTVLYAELRNPDQLVDGVLNHPLRQKIEALDGVQQAYESKQFREFKAVVSVIEAQLGDRWPDLLKTAAGAKIAAGVDAETEGVAILIQGRGEEGPQKLLPALIRLARQHADDSGNPDPVREGSYRDIKAYQVAEAKLAMLGSLLVITNKNDLGKHIIDRYVDQNEKSLAGHEQFKTVSAQASQDAVAWAYVDIAALRAAGVGREVFAGKAENPLAELLVGGILSNLQQTPYATISIHASNQVLRVEMATPHETDWIPESRNYYFGPQGTSAAPAMLKARDTVFSLSTYRNISEMWLRAGDLFNEQVIDGMAQAESNLSTLFAGKDFGEDILGAFGPEVQLIVTKQSFQPGDPQPAIKLPSFAASFKLKDPDTMRTDLRRTFQSMIGFLNVIGAMNGQPQLDMDMEKEGDRQLVTSQYVPEKDADPSRLKINYNFSPSVAFVGDRVIVASTGDLARELADSIGDKDNLQQGVNSAAAVNVQVLQEILSDNRGQLVAQNMLKEGHSKEEAEYAIDTLLTLLKFVDGTDVQFKVDDKQLKLLLEVRLAE